MELLHRFSIRKKLILIILGVSSTVIVLNLAINLIRDINNYKNDLVTNAEINARLIGESCVAPLLFGYSNEVEQVLAKLKSVPYVTDAFVYNSNDELYGSFHRSNELKVSPPKTVKNLSTGFIYDYLIVISPITFEGEFYGTVYMRVSTEFMRTEIRYSILIMVLMLLGAVIISYLLAVYFQKIISKPITNLAEVTSTIAQRNDYSIRVEPLGDDEITDLYKRFNYMFEVIQAKQEERNKAHNEIEKLNRGLEQKVADRTKELEKAKIVAENVSKAKSEFLANISHELRTPLNIINGNTQLLRMKVDQPNLNKMILNIENSGNQLTTMVNNIINFSESEKGLVDLEITDFYLEDIFQHLKTYYEKAAQKKGLMLKFNIDSNIPGIVGGDSNQLLKALSLLVDNAIKFTETGSVSISAGLISRESNKCKILFKVEDTGIGIHPDQLENLFTSVAQIDGSSTRKYGGIGLGLTLCNRIVTLMGGEISVESEPGKGSSFHFELELVESDNKDISNTAINFNDGKYFELMEADNEGDTVNIDDEVKSPLPTQILPDEELIVKLKELKTLLVDYSAEAGVKLREVGVLNGFKAEMTDLGNKISVYDYDSALVILEKIISSLS